MAKAIRSSHPPMQSDALPNKDRTYTFSSAPLGNTERRIRCIFFGNEGFYIEEDGTLRPMIAQEVERESRFPPVA